MTKTTLDTIEGLTDSIEGIEKDINSMFIQIDRVGILSILAQHHQQINFLRRAWNQLVDKKRRLSVLKGTKK